MQLTLMGFIRDACRALPQGTSLRIEFLAGELSVEMEDEYGTEINVEGPEQPGDVGYLQDAINTARKYAGLPHYYHESLIDRSVANEVE